MKKILYLSIMIEGGKGGKFNWGILNVHVLWGKCRVNFDCVLFYGACYSDMLCSAC